MVALTLAAGAQTPGGEPGPGESGSTETAQGRIIARVHDRTEDGVDDYRIEFGFFPEWALDEAESWPEAITSRSDWLPGSRFLTKSRIDDRADDDDRSWLRSSLITVPAQSAQSPGGAQTQITGRVVARYNPDSDGRLRDEFGFGDLRLEFLFVPQWAFTDTSSTAEAVARLSADNLPRARYLSVATIDARRDIWLRSSVVNVPLRAPVVVIEQPQAPVIDGVSCAPSSPTVNESVTCTATLSGGAPDSYAWSGGASGGSEAVYSTSFSSAGSKTVSLTATNSAGSDSASTTVSVGSVSANNPPNCPGAARQHLTDDMSISFTERYASLCTDPDGDALTWSLSSRDTSVVRVSESGDDWTIQAVADGLARIDVTATDPGGSSTRTSIEVLVVDPPRIAAVNCAPTRPVAGERVTCSATLGDGAAPDTTRWTGGTSIDDSGLTYTTSFDSAGDYLIYFDVSYLWIGSQRETAITVVEGALQPPVIDAVNCSPSAPSATETVVCSATLSGGAPESWAWRTADGTGSGVNHSTSFSKAGDYAVSLTVTNAAGSDSESVTLTVGALQAPVIDAVNCSPSSPSATETVVCSASLSGGAPESYAWRTADGSGSGVNHSTSFSKAGDYAVSLTVTNAAGSDSESITLTVAEEPPPAEGIQPPVIEAIICTPEFPIVNHGVSCTAKLSGGAPDTYHWGGSGVRQSGFTFSPLPAKAGDYVVSLTVANIAGSDSESITLTVAEEPPPPEDLEPPVIEAINCTPEFPIVNRGVYCSAELSGGVPDTYDWGHSVRTSVFSFSNAKTGEMRIALTVANAAGSDTHSIIIMIGGRLAPVIDGISCSPSSPTVDDAVTCTAALSGGAPVTWSWSGGASSGGSPTYNTSFNSAGSKTVSLTVTSGGGSATDSISLTAFDAVQAPVIDSVSCSPSAPVVNESVTCTATLSGGAPASYAWSGGADAGSAATYSTSFGSAGAATVSLAVTNSAGSDTDSFPLTVVATLQAPVVDSITCTPSDPAVGDPVQCTASLSGGTPSVYSWSGGRSASHEKIYSTLFWDVGAVTVSLIVANDAGQRSGSTTVTVNGYPQCNRAGTRQFAVGESWSGAAEAFGAGIVTCTDPDPLTYTLLSSNSDIVGVSESNGVWTVQGVAEGTAYVHVTVTDPGDLSTTSDLFVTIVASTGDGEETTDDSEETTDEELQAPVIDSISCSPASPRVDQFVTCTATLSGGAPASYSWYGGLTNSIGATYYTSFRWAGSKTVSLTVRNVAGRDTESITVNVPAQQAPVIDSISCSPASPIADHSVTCTATLSGGVPASYAWSSGGRGTPGISAEFNTLFRSTGSQTVSLTVTNSAGSDTDSISFTVSDAVPVIDSVRCTPASPTVDQSVTCRAVLIYGYNASFAWSGGASSSSSTRSGNTAIYNTSFSSAGSQTVSVTATNAAGSDTDSVTVTVAAAAVQAPVVDSVSCSPASPKVSDAVTCTATLSGGTPASYSWSGGSSSGSSATYNTSFSSSGSKTVSLTVTNASGSNSGSTTVTVAAAATVSAPVIDSISCSPASPTVNQSVSCTATLSGGAPTSYSWSGGTSSGSSAAYNTSLTGSTAVSLTVTNVAGSDTDSIIVNIAAQEAPVIDSISCSPSSPTVNQSVTCTATLSGGAPNAYPNPYFWSGGPVNSSLATYNTSFSSSGSKTVSLTVTNSAGSDTDSVTVTVVAVTVSAPVVDSVSCSPASPTVDQSVSCTATLSGGAPATYAWSGGSSSGSSAAYSTSFSSSGSKTVSLTVTNAGGSDSGSTTVTVAVPAPVIDSISCSPASPTVNQSVTCTAPLSGGYPTSHAWSGGTSSGSTIAHNTRSGDTAVYNTSFSSSGSKTVSLTVTNSAGSDSDSVAVTVAVPAPVVDSVSCSPASPTVDQSVSCTATLSGGAPASYSWSGGALSGSSATYSTGFGSSGSKTVSLTVTNAGGSDTDSVTVTVSEEAPVIASVSCTPASPTVGQAVTCRAILSHGYNASFAWSGSAPSAWSGGTYVTSYSSAGSKTISVTATNATGSDSDSVTVTVVAAE